MKKILLIFGLIIFISTNSICQIDYNKLKKQKIHPIRIDTLNENIIIVHQRFYTLYFRQSDIKEYAKIYSEKINVLLNEKNRRTDLNDWSEYTDDEINRLSGMRNFPDKDKPVLVEFNYLGAELINNGKFMIIERQTGNVIENGIKMKKIHERNGSSFVQFHLSSGLVFWEIITRLRIEE